MREENYEEYDEDDGIGPSVKKVIFGGDRCIRWPWNAHVSLSSPSVYLDRELVANADNKNVSQEYCFGHHVNYTAQQRGR